MTKAKSCPPGKYWCFDDKKCKKIPLGYHIGLRGYLYPDEDGKSNNDNGNSNGHSGNGNGSNGNGSGGGVSEMKENFKRINANGQTYAVMLSFRGRTYNIQMFIPKQTRPTRLEVEQEVNKIYPGAIVRYFEPRVWDPTNPALIMPESMQPGAKDLVQQSNYMKPALQQKQQKKSKKPVKNECGCKEEFTLKKVSEVMESSFDIDPKKHKQERKDAKIGNLARKTTNPGEKAAAEKKAKGPKLFGEDTVRVEGQLGYVEFIDLIKPEPMKGIAERKLTKGEEEEKERVVKGMKKSFKGFRKRYGDDAESVMYATATKLAKEEVQVDEKFATQYKDKGKLSKTDASGSRHDHTHNVDPRMTDYVPKGKIRKSSKAETRANVLKFDMKNEEVLDERLGGKGYKRRKDYAGREVSGDWEDSDRGAGNKAARRSGKNVEKKSPTYQAYVRNKIKEQLAPHIKKGVAAAKPLVKAQALQTGLPTTKEKPKPPEKKSSKSVFSQLTNKDEID